MAAKDKTLNLYTENAFKHEGEHYAVGSVLTDIDFDTAMELTGAGRTRLATAEDLAAVGKKKRGAQPAKETPADPPGDA
jgi:hypothetical protein